MTAAGWQQAFRHDSDIPELLVYVILNCNKSSTATKCKRGLYFLFSVNYRLSNTMIGFHYCYLELKISELFSQ